MTGSSENCLEDLERFLELDLSDAISKGDDVALEEVATYLLRRSRVIRKSLSLNGVDNVPSNCCHEAADLLVNGVDILERAMAAARRRTAGSG